MEHTTIGSFLHMQKGEFHLNELDYKLCHLQRVRWIGIHRILYWLSIDPELTSLYQISPNELQKLFSLTSQQAEESYKDLHDSRLRLSVYNDIKRYQVVTINNSYYPPLLKQIPDPPIVLYVHGKLDYLSIQPKLSVIGTRNPSIEARKKIEYLVKPLLQNNWVIVSGMAKGIDSMAHQVAIQNHGKTIAVLGFGFEHIYPEENKRLMDYLGKYHLLISEFPPSTPPKKWHFPARNRIISGLSFGSLIIEAKERSGTFITAEQALEQGRDVFVVPGSIFMQQTKGCHILIKEGAQLVQHADDLLEAWKNVKHNYHPIENQQK
jgi:DNA processing protein